MHRPRAAAFPLALCAVSLLALFILALPAAPTFAQTTRPSLPLRAASKPPTLDGKLDDECWKDAPAITDFRQAVPIPGADPTEKTEVRFLYDRDHLYIAIRCFDSQPAQIIARQLQHDTSLGTDDLIKIAFDTFNRRRDGYYFATNPAGARVEGLVQNFSQENKLWDTIWDARCRIDDQGWTAEITIPFKSLSFDPRSGTWGCNIERVIRRKQEFVRWTTHSTSRPMTTLAEFGELRDIGGARQGIGLDFKPYTTLKYRDDARNGDEEWTFKPGFDLIYRITPSLTAQASVNTDFAEADVDERRVNLTRFPLFYPEKRDFFLQDASLFSFGGIGTSPLPYYSRRIGLDAQGQPVDILGAARLTGRIGPTSVALLDVQQDDHDDVDSTNLAVARISTQALNGSNVGLIATNGDPIGGADNTLVGTDFNYLNTRLPGGKQLIGHSYFMATSSDRVEDEDYAFGASLDYSNEPVGWEVGLSQIGEDFDPALGFVERTGIRSYYASTGYTWRPNKPWLRQFFIGVAPSVETDLDNSVVAEDHDLPQISFSTPAGDGAWMDYSFNRDVVDEPFEIWRGVVLPPDDYRWSGYHISLYTSEARPISFGAGYRTGSFYSGHRTDYSGSFELRPLRGVTTGMAYTLQEARLDEGDFDARIASARLNIAFSPNLFWTNVVQWDNASESVGYDSRVRWTLRPGNDLFIAFSHGYAVEDFHFERLSTTLIVKAGLTIRF